MEKTVKHNFSFWIHLFITILAWVGPFLFSWQLMIAAYTIVTLQFIFLKKCVLNATHDLDDDDNATFYSYLLEYFGFKVDRAKIKFVVRNYLYILFGIFSYCWQEILGIKALLF
jgi:hypothetical protein